MQLVTQPVHVTIRFLPPGFFLNSPKVRIVLDDHWVVYHGGFVHGFRVDIPVAPGPHRLTVVLETGVIDRTKHHWVNFPANMRHDVLLEYSRLWGNFGDPKVTSAPA